VIYLILVLVALAAAVAIYIVKRGANAGRDTEPASARAAIPEPVKPAPAPAVSAPATAPTISPAAPASSKPAMRGIVRAADTHIAAMLNGFEWAHSADLSKQEAAEIVDVLQRIPRPPSALHKLVSPEFLANANTVDLADMVIAEPQIAAKVLAAVNAPFYGLKSPLASVGQAVTFMGMNTVRSICLQYMLDESFQSKDPEVKKLFERLWNASAFASELCFKLAQALQLPDAGALVTQVVLSFLGHVASHSLLSRVQLQQMMAKGMLERARVEQRELGLCAAEIGSLLMREWALPEPIVEGVRNIDLTLVTPFDAAHAERVNTAFCYICARLGERLAFGEIQDLATVDLAADASLEFFHVQSYLKQPPLSRMNELLQSPELVASINAMVRSMRVRR